LLACGPAVNDSAVMLKLPTAAFVVSNAIPIKVGLETETELAPLPVNVMDWLLGPKVICAASAPVPQSATKAWLNRCSARRKHLTTRLAGPRVGAFWKPDDPALISVRLGTR
jgi:hypothetical protein